jgi:hypothetical protein
MISKWTSRAKIRISKEEEAEKYMEFFLYGFEFKDNGKSSDIL